MNHSYRLVWNQEAQRYVPAPECAKGRGKSASKALAPAAVLLAAAFALPTWAAPPAANALPTGGQVVSGNASIGQSGNAMTVNQGSQKAIIDWTSFDIGKNAGVTFVQPNANAVALNRVTAGDASQIHGQLNANGQVWLINPNGVVFGQGSKVDVGGLVASTLNITNADFNNGNYRFTRNGATGSIVNQGELTAKGGGYVALLAPTVRNDGIIRAQLGTVAMAAGDQITLQAGANGLLNVQVDPATVRTLIENKQLIVADGGQVIMTGKAADALSASVVANTGTIQANSLQAKDGKILLIADMRHGETKAAGQFEAKFVDTSAATVSIDKDLKVNTAGGEWLIDPVNITIDTNKAQAIEAALGTGNVTVSTADNANNPWGTNSTGSDAGDIHVNADISYTQNKLTLTADRDINVNAQINVNGSGTLALHHGSSANVNVKGQVNFEKTGTGLLAINGANYTVIKDVTALQGMSGTSHFALGGHIDASATAGWNGGAGFNPLNLINGVFDGLGHTISGLTIKQSANGMRTGLFSMVTDAQVRNLGLTDVDIHGSYAVGALAGSSYRSSIYNVYAEGKVTGNQNVGGLVGENIVNAANSISSIRNAQFAGQVTGTYGVGGLVGSNSADGDNAAASISHSHAAAQVNGVSDVGGLVGRNSVNGSSGNPGSGTASISYSYASGDVTASGQSAGGLVGSNSAHGGMVRIDNAYATGRVTADSSAGGLVGKNFAGRGGKVIVSHAYATGKVTGNSQTGGLVGWSNRWDANTDKIDIYYAYWDTDRTGQTGSADTDPYYGAKTTVQMAQESTYAGFNFDTSWRIHATGASTEGYVFNGLPTLQGVTAKTDYQHFESGTGTVDNPWVLTGWQQLQNINHGADTLAGHYRLNADLDKYSLGYTAYAGATANGGAGWQPIGGGSNAFTGIFDGLGNTLGGLTIDRPTESNVGLFGKTQNATLRNVGLVGASVVGGGNVGALVGWSRANNFGGSDISNAFATGAVSGANTVGGLVGYHDAFNSGTANITNAYATVAVSATGGSVGGLVGRNYGGAKGTANITNAYATGAVSGTWAVGGLVGISALDSVAYITNTYATGAVSGTSDVGGLVGSNSVTSRINNSFWNTETTGQTVSAGGTGKTTAELQQASTFAAWGDSISAKGGEATVWRIYEGQTGPLLRSFLKQVTVTADASSITGKIYDGQKASGAIGSYTTNTPGAALDGGLGYATNSKNAGDYSMVDGTLMLGGLYSGQQGYDISYVADSTLTIAKKALTVTGTTVAGRTYDGGTNVLNQTIRGSLTAGGVVSQDDVTLKLTSATLDSKNAGSRTATVAYGLTGDDADNYIVAGSTHSGVEIAKKAITVSGITAVGKTYDGSTDATLRTGGVQFHGLEADDDVHVLAASGRFDNKNAGTGKTVTLTGATYGGDDLGNYTIADQARATADIAKAAITISANDMRKTYDGTTAANGTAKVTGGTLFGSDSLSGGSFAYADKNAGANKTVNVSGVTVKDGNGGNNYDVSYAANTGSTIDKAALQITAGNANKILGSTLVLNGSTGFTATGLQGGERIASVTLGSDGTRADAKVGKHGILASNAQGGWGFDASNYDLTYEAGTLTVTPGLPEGGNIWHAQHPQLLAGAPAFATLPAGQPAGGVPHLALAPGFIRVQEGE